MSVNFGSLLSNSGVQALAKYQSTVDSSNKYGQTYAQVLSGVSTENTYTGSYTGMSSSIFNVTNYSSGYSSSSSSDYHTGKNGLNTNGAVNRQVVNASVTDGLLNPFGSASNGSSVIDNFYTSIQNVALGQYAPTSVFEQRLNYHLDYSQQNKSGSMLGNFSNYMNVDSVANNLGTSASSIFGDKSSSGVNGSSLSVSNASTVSQLMTLLG